MSDQQAEDTQTDGVSTDDVTTGGEAVVAALEAAGVEYLFGVQGGAIMPVYDALYDSDLEHVTMAHEQGAAHAADAYATVTGSPGVCLATSGPGATNLVTGLADAAMDSDPLVALTGQAPTHLLGKDAFQETDTVGVTRPVTKTSAVVTDPDSIVDAVGEAYAVANRGRPGPTLVDLPKDVTQAETGRVSADPALSNDHARSGRADPDLVESAATAVAAAARPVVLSGGGVIRADASAVLRRLAIEHGVPVVTTMPGLGSFPETHALSMGVAGMHGTGYANLAVGHCDLLLAVGTRFDDRLTGGVESFAPGAEIVHVDVDPSEIHKNVHADHPLVGDAGIVLDQLFDAIPGSPEASGWRKQLREWKREYSLADETPTDAPIHPRSVVGTLDELTPEDTIVTTGVGQHQMWAMQYWTFTRPRTWISSHGLGTMGYGLPAAIGARLAAAADRHVVCFEGDGSLLMTLQELAVAVREDLDLTVVVLNNEAVGMVRQWQDAFYDGRRVASEYPWVPQFDTVAEAFGAAGYRVHDPEDVETTLAAALADDGPSVVDVHVDPGADVYPMVPSGGDNTAFAVDARQLEEL